MEGQELLWIVDTLSLIITENKDYPLLSRPPAILSGMLLCLNEEAFIIRYR